ncbi:MAG: hypothetical protein LC794_10485 [Acidobacteria bacterium]|nr:hypothetical protein [Acidobacteriota bacterium]MCA1627093.1 hypothetical protein [Acidobacteriota bacterium]
MSYPTCLFCGRDDSPPSHEHVIPKWIPREFPGGVWDITNRLTQHVRAGRKYIDLTIRAPCERCNNGWLSRLEQIAKPILLPLIHGTATDLRLLEQRIIAVWLFKTAVMYDLHSEKYAPRPRYFDDDELRLLAKTGGFNGKYRMFVGEYFGTQHGFMQEDHSGLITVERDTLKPVSDPVRIYSFTFAIERLILQIFCAKLKERGTSYIRDFRDFYVELGISANPVSWPPPKPMNEEMAEAFTHRWFDIQVPPISE